MSNQTVEPTEVKSAGRKSKVKLEVAPLFVDDTPTNELHALDTLKTAVFSDGSHYTANAWDVLPDLVKRTTDAIGPWYRGWSVEKIKSAEIAQLNEEICRLVVLSSGQFDYAGNSHAYRELYGKRYDAALDAVKAGPEARKALAQKVREWRSFNKRNPLMVAQDLVKLDPEFGKTTIKVGAVEQTYADLVENATNGVTVKLPPAFQTKIREVYRTQESVDGKRLKGFADTDVPTTIGDKRKRVAASKTPAATTPGVGWSQARSDLAGRKITAAKLSAEMLLTLTAWSDFLLGSPADPQVEWKDSERKALLKSNRDMQHLLNATIAAMDPDDPATRKIVESFRVKSSTK